MRGQPCPIPVVEAKKALALKDTDEVELLVDNIIAVQNLEKMARGNAYGFSFREEGSLYKVIIAKDANHSRTSYEPLPPDADSGHSSSGRVFLITSDKMGRGADELGQLLMKGFIYSLTELNPAPEALIFLGSGVFLTAEGASTVPDLKKLENSGTKIFTCGTCASYYKLTESIAAGSIADMMSITNLLAKAAGTITI